MTRPLLLLLPLLSLSCFGPREDDGLDKYGRTPDLAARYRAAVESRELLRGMHEDEVLEVMRGKPEKKSRRDWGATTYEVWEYRSRSLDLYFDDDGYLMRWRGP